MSKIFGKNSLIPAFIGGNPPKFNYLVDTHPYMLRIKSLGIIFAIYLIKAGNSYIKALRRHSHEYRRQKPRKQKVSLV
ncbi:hypothetical protein [Thermanaeromonas toyohensis]|uniref:hypothetical protein n=1 Tax=Thermanaeromonas toyohensis TaxID=161154 RepID=UPI00155FDE3A|nr:hypothetical protein [Thermanaeromonas toyohensis]